MVNCVVVNPYVVLPTYRLREDIVVEGVRQASRRRVLRRVNGTHVLKVFIANARIVGGVRNGRLHTNILVIRRPRAIIGCLFICFRGVR